MANNPTFNTVVSTADRVSGDVDSKPAVKPQVPQDSPIRKITATSLDPSFDITRVSTDPDGGFLVRKEGWLTKTNPRGKKQERHFKLTGAMLAWSKLATDRKDLNTIDLSQAKLNYQASDPNTLVLRCSSLGKGKEKDYILSSPDPATTRAWYDAIKTAQESKMYQSGWLMKNKRRLWCLLQNSTLYSFSREQDPCADFRKAIVESLKLYGAGLKDVDGTTFEIFDIVTKGKPHVIQAKTEADKKAWYSALNSALDKCSENLLAGTEKFGYLKMKGQRRFILLTEGRLSWYSSPADIVEKGSLFMEYCKVKPDEVDSLTFVVYSTVDTNQMFSFTAAHSDEYASWFQVLQHTEVRQRSKTQITAEKLFRRFSDVRISKSGWVVSKNKKRFFVLQDAFLMWFADEPSEGKSQLQGNISLMDCTITKEDFSFSVRAPHMKVYSFLVQTKQDVDAWVASLVAAIKQARELEEGVTKPNNVDIVNMFSKVTKKRGMMVLKGKKVVIELSEGLLVVYEDMWSDKAAQKITLEGCSVSHVGGQSLIMRSFTSAFVFQCIENDAQDWYDAVSVFIMKANEAVTNGLEKKGWLLVNRGKYLWFALRNGRLMWFNVIQPLAAINETSAKGSLLVSECKVAKLVAPNSFEIISKGGKKMEFRADSEQEYASWLESLHASDTRRQADPQVKNRVLGVDIRTLLVQDKGLSKSGEVPFVLRRVLEAVEAQVGQQQEATSGIFQQPANFANMRAAVTLLNNDLDADLSGFKAPDLLGLLKQFLKKLPDALLTYKLYPHFINWEPRHGWEALQTTVKRLPEEHYHVLKYLLNFLSRSRSDEQSMATAFAPLILRENASTEPSDAALLRSVQVMRMLLSAYDEIFETGTNPVVSETFNALNIESLLAKVQSNMLASNKASDKQAIFAEVSQLVTLLGAGGPQSSPPAEDLSSSLNDLLTRLRSKEGVMTLKKLNPADRGTVVNGLYNIETLLSDLQEWKPKPSTGSAIRAASPVAAGPVLTPIVPPQSPGKPGLPSPSPKSARASRVITHGSMRFDKNMLEQQFAEEVKLSRSSSLVQRRTEDENEEVVRAELQRREAELKRLQTEMGGPAPSLASLEKAPAKQRTSAELEAELDAMLRKEFGLASERGSIAPMAEQRESMVPNAPAKLDELDMLMRGVPSTAGQDARSLQRSMANMVTGDEKRGVSQYTDVDPTMRPSVDLDRLLRNLPSTYSKDPTALPIGERALQRSMANMVGTSLPGGSIGSSVAGASLVGSSVAGSSVAGSEASSLASSRSGSTTGSQSGAQSARSSTASGSQSQRVTASAIAELDNLMEAMRDSEDLEAKSRDSMVSFDSGGAP